MRFLHCVVSALLLAALPAIVRAGVVVTVEAAGVQTSVGQGAVTTETFDSIPLGNYTSLATAVGTITDSTGHFTVIPADQFGGAGGTGRYTSVGAQSGSGAPDNLALSVGPTTYFGFWLSAMDANNQILIYSGGTGGTLLFTINQSYIQSLVGTSGAYYGNPNGFFNGTNDSGESFQYININANGGTTFDTVVFSNSNQTGTGLETDNYSILASSPVPLPSAAGTGVIAMMLAGGALVLRRSVCRA